jgi:hypothetical protein
MQHDSVFATNVRYNNREGIMDQINVGQQYIVLNTENSCAPKRLIGTIVEVTERISNTTKSMWRAKDSDGFEWGFYGSELQAAGHDLDRRLEVALKNADKAFWNVIEKAFPEVDIAVITPEFDIKFKEAAEVVIQDYISGLR